MKSKSLLGAALAASLLAFGAAAQAQNLNPMGDLDRDGIQNRYDQDRDGDGLSNRSDPNPNVFNRTYVARNAHDMDHDGIADRSDRDRDGDGIPNARDPHPNRFDARVARNGPRGDRDGDGVINRLDRFPNNPRRA
jgi:hypothetical protein